MLDENLKVHKLYALLFFDGGKSDNKKRDKPGTGDYMVMACAIQQQIQQQAQIIVLLVLLTIFCCKCVIVEVNAWQM